MGRDPSTLEVLGSSSSDENKSLLMSNLYMTAANKSGEFASSNAAWCYQIAVCFNRIRFCLSLLPLSRRGYQPAFNLYLAAPAVAFVPGQRRAQPSAQEP